jgi:hypothetical protein
VVHDNFPAGVIITKGLGGNGCESFVLAHFHLFIPRPAVGSPAVGSPAVGSPVGGSPLIEIEARVVQRGVPHGLEGTALDPRQVYDPWRRWERDEDEEPWKPPQDEKEVTLRVRVGNKEIERTYFRKDADRAIKAINFANKTKDQISVTIDKIKDTTQKAGVSFKGFRKKKDEDSEDKE